MSSIDNYLNCDLKPTEVRDSYWLYEQDEAIVRKYPLANGKWMQFYHKSQLDAMWEFVKSKYHAGRLEGVTSMKVSTSCEQPRARNSSEGVIIFYCGPSEDEAAVMYFGQKLLEQVLYTSLTGWMTYKSDEQTLAGTRATGQTRNYLYKLWCGRR